jgi:4-hydroxy-3-methylbut-2-en-1-yl diphosphate reductase
VTDPPLLVCAPLRLEALALRRRLPSGVVRHTGYGRRSRIWASRPAASAAVARVQALAVAGVGVATAPALRPGDVVVATDVVDLTRPGIAAMPCAFSGVLVASLRGAGHRVFPGRIVTVGHLVAAEEARRLGIEDVLAADMESAYLARLAGTRPLAVVRVVVDTPARPLRRPDVVVRGTAALVRLADVGAALAAWARALPPAPLQAPKEILQ